MTVTDLRSGGRTNAADQDGRRYAKLGPRIRAALYDWALSIIVIVLTLSIAISSQSYVVSPLIGSIGAMFVLFYEPVMVWTTGSTLGHMAYNLRVIDDRTLGNPSFLKATVRFLVKALLGWFSFITIMASQRRRAIHDVLSRSTVQVRHFSSNEGV